MAGTFVSTIFIPSQYGSPGNLRVKKDFDTHHENLRIFMEGEEASGNLKICGFSGRFPDGRNCFSCACAPEKPSATYTPPRSIWKGFTYRVFLTVCSPGDTVPRGSIAFRRDGCAQCARWPPKRNRRDSFRDSERLPGNRQSPQRRGAGWKDYRRGARGD